MGCEIGAYLSIVGLAGAEQSIKRVVSRNDKAGEVDKKFSSNVEEDEEEIEAKESKEHVDFRHTGLALKVGGGRIL